MNVIREFKDRLERDDFVVLKQDCEPFIGVKVPPCPARCWEPIFESSANLMRSPTGMRNGMVQRSI